MSFRESCARCRKPVVTCYCSAIRPFTPEPLFVFLVHPEEARKAVGTARMAHLCLSNSLFFVGEDFSRHEEVNSLIDDSQNFPVVLFPDTDANPIEYCHQRRRPVVFVLDGTWSQAKRIRRLSRNFDAVPKIAFTPPAPSIFLIRKQPRPDCYSTIEAVHHVIDVLSPRGYSDHHQLLDVFSSMVTQQLRFEAEANCELTAVQSRHKA